ncbi:MAG: DUF4105 domain-containing protein [Desulfocapsaceae bacterium]
MTPRFHYFKLIFKILFFLCLALAWLWGGTALYLSGPGPYWLKVLLACLFGLCLPAAFIFTRSFMRASLSCLAVFAVLLIWWQTLTPTLNKDWAADVAQISHGEIIGDNLIMYNVRNFNYKCEDDFDQIWETKTYDLSNLRGLDLFLSYWASDNIAHTILSWDFGVDGHLAISIETRKDKTQKYSAIKGFFKQYEIAYVAADERDIIRLRTNYRKERVYLYRFEVPSEHVLALLKNYLKEMNKLVDTPQFYDALTHNCTTTIKIHADAINPGEPPPLDWRLLATGHVDELLYDSKKVSTSVPFAELRQASRVDLKMQKEGREDFPKKMRAYIKRALEAY